MTDDRHKPRRPPWFLLAMTVLAMASFGLGVWNQIGQQDIQDVRNEDRITADLQACERGNKLRSDVRDGFRAVDEAVNGIINVATSARPERETTAALRQKLEAPLSKLDTAVEGIEFIDCTRAVPGAPNP